MIIGTFYTFYFIVNYSQVNAFLISSAICAILIYIVIVLYYVIFFRDLKKYLKFYKLLSTKLN